MCPNMYKLNHNLSRHFQKSYNSSRCYTKQLKCFSITAAWHALVNDLLWESIIHTLFLPRLLMSTLTGLLMFLSFSSLSPFMMHRSQFTAFNSLLPLLSDLLLWKKGAAIHELFWSESLSWCSMVPHLGSTGTREKKWFWSSCSFTCLWNILSVSRPSLCSQCLIHIYSMNICGKNYLTSMCIYNGYLCLLDSCIWMGINFHNRS